MKKSQKEYILFINNNGSNIRIKYSPKIVAAHRMSSNVKLYKSTERKLKTNLNSEVLLLDLKYCRKIYKEIYYN